MFDYAPLPAIHNPICSIFASLGVVSAIILPSYITPNRSDKDIISSSSVETSITAHPWSRWQMRCFRINSLAPMSTPRVGCAAMRKRGLLSSSRATTNFCWFPPESVANATSSLGAFTLYFLISSPLYRCSFFQLIEFLVEKQSW